MCDKYSHFNSTLCSVTIGSNHFTETQSLSPKNSGMKKLPFSWKKPPTGPCAYCMGRGGGRQYCLWLDEYIYKCKLK